jgi:hypothetical protein
MVFQFVSYKIPFLAYQDRIYPAVLPSGLLGEGKLDSLLLFRQNQQPHRVTRQVLVQHSVQVSKALCGPYVPRFRAAGKANRRQIDRHIPASPRCIHNRHRGAAAA